MVQRLHFVFGGELVDPARPEFRDPAAIDMVGVFGDYASAPVPIWQATPVPPMPQ